jgi:hypothetical protein
MIIREAGNHGPAAKIDAPRRIARMLCDRLIAADGDEPSATDRDGLRIRECRIDRDDLAVVEDGLRRLGTLQQLAHIGPRIPAERYPDHHDYRSGAPGGSHEAGDSIAKM